MKNWDNKLVKKKKIDKDTTLTITQNEMSGRFFVEFSMEKPRVVLQKNFPDTFDGRLAQKSFIEKFKSTEDLKKYFGLK